MAGDWIKMRGALIDHPKVIAIGRELQKNKEFREWLTPGGSGVVNGRIVSARALRCVTTALLMRVWSVSREHGQFVGDDLLLSYSSIDDLDEMAGAPGVGAAMQSVKWAIEENGVTLPNFKEFNVPMTAAEKQKSYRDRNGKGNGAVTESLPKSGNENSENVTSRVEKRRSTSPISPSRAEASSGGNGAKRTRTKLPATPCPAEFEVTEPMAQWAVAKGLPANRVMPETEQFMQHYRAKGQLWHDWHSAWQKWIGKAVEFGARR